MSKSFTYDAAGYPISPCGCNHMMFGPDDLNALQHIFDDCLGECTFSIDSKTAESLGSAIIRLYSQGQHDPILIKTILLPSFKRRS
ncbi:hypothetical protein IB238_21380 [Rhizobium sp. ARZ01]|uniref:hypothetical protein n=1 Tax=Rhizobium sp. ARZ01 TaxID=2769313 RepID=UPI0017857AAF|nr:hypothetical protein [Rhizobium sp. ARZ01]MBD9375179.1 hypothetical protein [Rhizobium sp. ARZ01]